MKQYLVLMLILGAFLLMNSGCGQKGSLIDAKQKLEKLKAEFLKKSETEIQIYEPQKASNPKKIGSADKEKEINPYTGKAVPVKYVQFISGRTFYVFDELQADTIPYSVTVEAHSYHIYHAPIPEKEYREFERNTGQTYNPTATPEKSRVEVKFENIFFEYNMDTAEWEEKKREIVFDMYGSDE